MNIRVVTEACTLKTFNSTWVSASQTKKLKREVLIKFASGCKDWNGVIRQMQLDNISSKKFRRNEKQPLKKREASKFRFHSIGSPNNQSISLYVRCKSVEGRRCCAIGNSLDNYHYDLRSKHLHYYFLKLK